MTTYIIQLLFFCVYSLFSYVWLLNIIWLVKLIPHQVNSLLVVYDNNLEAIDLVFHITEGQILPSKYFFL